MLFCLLAGKNANAQVSRAFFDADGIQTVLFYPQKDMMSVPVVTLGADEALSLQFDELYGNTRTLMYQFEHCDADWQKSNIIELDFISGFNKFYEAETSRLSFNTTTDYVHYDMLIPTAELRISGNYILRVFDATDEQLLISRPFMVCENTVGVTSRVVYDGRPGDAWQRLSFSVQHPAVKVSSASAEIKINVWQNMRMSEARQESVPTFVRNNELVYENTDQLTFEAANEGRWLDNRSLKYTMTGSAGISFHDPFYHYTLAPDGTPAGYYYHEDFNGFRYIEARDIHDDPRIAADYTLVHFTLPRPTDDADIYVYGELTNWQLAQSNKMAYDAGLQQYTLTLQLKQGLHNYQYMAVPHASHEPQLTLIENSFPETENDYYIAVYYRSYSDTYDRLIGFKRHNSIKTINSFVH